MQVELNTLYKTSLFEVINQTVNSKMEIELFLLK